MNPLLRVFVSIAVTAAAGLLSFFFFSSVEWYDALTKPDFFLPDWIFVLGWFVSYCLSALALAIIWSKNPETPDTESWARFYFIQLIFNVAWFLFVFSFHSLILGFIEMLVYVFAIICLVLHAFELDKRAWALMLPYIGWLLLMMCVNGQLWYLN